MNLSCHPSSLLPWRRSWKKSHVMAMPPSSGWGLKPCGWQAHDHLLRELLAAARSDRKLTLADTVAGVQLCTQANQVAVDERT
jgi:hypothetical protein